MTAETEAMIDVAATHRPRDLTGARAAVLAARDDDANILVRGAGTKLSWAGRPTTVQTARRRAWQLPGASARQVAPNQAAQPSDGATRKESDQPNFRRNLGGRGLRKRQEPDIDY